METSNIYPAALIKILDEAKFRVNILHIEDNPADVVLFRHYLLGSGNYKITNVASVVEAFSLIENAHFDVIVLDLNLLDMDGLACIAAINSKSPETPMVIHSGSLDESLESAAFLCGAKKFISKNNCDGKLLETAIREVLYND